MFKAVYALFTALRILVHLFPSKPTRLPTMNFMNPRTPIRALGTTSHESLQFRNSLAERSPTLVGDSPASSTRKTTAVSASAHLSQMSASFDEVPAENSTISSGISTRRKPTCMKCKMPRKGHKRGQCPIPVSDDSGSLYASSPENERRTPAETSVKSECPAEEEPPSATASFSSVSVGGKRKQPRCRKCGWPTKGHKRPNGVLQCPAGSPDREADVDLVTSKLNPSSPTSATPSRATGTEMSSLDTTPVATRSTDVDPKCSAHIQVTIRGKNPAPMNSSASNITPPSSHRYRRNIIPPTSALSEHRSSYTPIRPLAYPPSRSPQHDPESDGETSDRRFSNHSPSPMSTASSYSSVSDYRPMDNPGLKSQETEPSFPSLYQALGEPDLTIYSACDRGDAAQIRDKAKALRYFSGVVNVKAQGRDMMNDDKLANMVMRSSGNEPDMNEESHSYAKWVIMSKKEDIVRRYIDIYNALQGRVSDVL